MPSDGLVARHAQRAVEVALGDTRVVVVLGARQVGKSTLLEQVASAEGAGREVLTLDDQAVRSAASVDPAGFIATLKTPVAIDEIQRVPELMTEIKLRVDRDKTPGQFAITGSANLLEIPSHPVLTGHSIRPGGLDVESHGVCCGGRGGAGSLRRAE